MLVGCAIVGCAESGKGRYGEAIPLDKSVTRVKTILDSPTVIENTDVIVSGRIVWKCPCGCSAWLEDSGSEIYVKLRDAGMFIPKLKVGAVVSVIGKVVVEQGEPEMYAYGLKF